ncbi:hypothetical protein C8Q75DRAFT_254200 [Abortiporus biennis]|nr:hypothetical protein C8Q75DRAFT_254200 [Abortiporus biennis]
MRSQSINVTTEFSLIQAHSLILLTRTISLVVLVRGSREYGRKSLYKYCGPCTSFSAFSSLVSALHSTASFADVFVVVVVFNVLDTCPDRF